MLHAVQSVLNPVRGLTVPWLDANLLMERVISGRLAMTACHNADPERQQVDNAAEIKPSESPAAWRSAWARYGVAIASVGLGWLGRNALTPGVGATSLPFVFFFAAVALSAWYGGL